MTDRERAAAIIRSTGIGAISVPSWEDGVRTVWNGTTIAWRYDGRTIEPMAEVERLDLNCLLKAAVAECEEMLEDVEGAVAVLQPFLDAFKRV